MRKTVTTICAAALAAATLLCPAAPARAQGRPESVPAGGGRPGEEAREPAGLRIGIARLKYGGGGDWYSDPSSLPNLLEEFERRTGIPTENDDRILESTSPNLFEYPFLYMTGHGNVSMTSSEVDRLREHLLAGGFLWADDNYGMDDSFRRLMERVFPARPLGVVPLDHEIYSSFYELDGPPKIHEHDGKAPVGLGIEVEGRLAVFYTYESDIGDGLEDPEVHGDPPGKREQAIRMAVNVLYYALTR